jgi:outer membrane receptor protein involved in Fe transport
VIEQSHGREPRESGVTATTPVARVAVSTARAAHGEREWRAPAVNALADAGCCPCGRRCKRCKVSTRSRGARAALGLRNQHSVRAVWRSACACWVADTLLVSLRFLVPDAAGRPTMNAILPRLAGAVAGALGFASTALAQTPPEAAAAPAAAGEVQEVVVTGSRIAAPNLASTSPITVVDQRAIRTTGRTDMSDLIMMLPQNYDNGLGQDLGNKTSGLTTAGGVATADLRGLGPNRTLVLVDGVRLGIGSPYTFIQQPAPDLDQIPTFLVERVEVVTGGASATYGSDAIAGVINFIMKKNFQGVQFDGQLGVNYHDNNDTFWQEQNKQFGNNGVPTGGVWDGHNRQFSMMVGTNFADNKGNVTGYFSYFHTDPVAGAQRDWSSCMSHEVLDSAGNVVGQTCGGSSNSNWFKPLTSTAPGFNNIYSVYGTNFVPNGSVVTTPPASFNSQPYIFMTREDTRYTAGFLAHQDVQDWFKPYLDFYFTDDQTHQAVAPAALFKDSNPNDPLSNNYNTNCSNPLLSAQQASLLCTPAQIAADRLNPGSQTVNIQIGRRNIEGGARNSDYEHTSYRAVFGTKGEFLDAWNYDAYGGYYYVNFFNSNSKFFNFANVDNALLVKGTAANPVCISGSPCVPYNIWRDGGVTPQQLEYLYITGTGSGSYTLRTLHAEITGDLGHYGLTLPTARDGIALNVGYEHRNEHQFFNPDSAETSGQLSGFGSAAVPIDATNAVGEAWAELRLPLVQDKAFAKDLMFDTGFRHSNYTYSGGVDTYKFELQWAPIRDIRFRGTYQKAIRAPSIIELFNPQLVALIQSSVDPCAPTIDKNGVLHPATASFTQCQAQGVTQAQYGNGGTTNLIPQCTAGQCSQLTGGNPQLSPEESKSWTAGFTLSPEAVPTLSGSIDYYHIALTNAVGVIPASVIMSDCLATLTAYCDQIVRSPATGGITGATIAGGGYIKQTNVNTGAALVSGVDLQLSYGLGLPAKLGGVQFALNGTYLQHFESTPLPGAHTYDCAGLFGLTCQTVNSRWRHIARATWQMPINLDFAVTWRYIGKVSQDNNSSDPTLHFATYGAYSYQPAVIGSYSYIDLAFTYHALKNLEIRGGVNNVADKDPPVVPQTIQPGGANTYSAYDQLGRELFIAFTAHF